MFVMTAFRSDLFFLDKQSQNRRLRKLLSGNDNIRLEGLRKISGGGVES